MVDFTIGRSNMDDARAFIEGDKIAADDPKGQIHIGFLC